MAHAPSKPDREIQRDSPTISVTSQVKGRHPATRSVVLPGRRVPSAPKDVSTTSKSPELSSLETLMTQTHPGQGRLEAFLLLAKSTKGAAAAQLVQEVTAAPGVYVFAELAEVQNIRETLAQPEYQGAAVLLKTFSLGTLSDLVSSPESFPAVSQAHVDKLRLLTLVTLASRARTLDYSTLIQHLHLGVYIDEAGRLNSSGVGSTSDATASTSLTPSVIRRLEDVIIDSIYAGLISGKFDQKRQTFHVASVIGRDVSGEEELANFQVELSEWHNTSKSVISQLSQRIDAARQQAQWQEQKRLHHEQGLSNVLATVISNEGKGGREKLGWSNEDEGMDVDEDGPEGSYRAMQSSKKSKRTKT